MITISKADFEEKDKSFKCWVWFLEFSRNTSRCTLKIIPTEATIKICTKEYSAKSYITIIAYNPKNGSRLCNIGSTTTIKGDIVEINNSHLCETREEAIELYNAAILNEIDRLTSLYEGRINYLNKKFIK